MCTASLATAAAAAIAIALLIVVFGGGAPAIFRLVGKIDALVYAARARFECNDSCVRMVASRIGRAKVGRPGIAQPHLVDVRGPAGERRVVVARGRERLLDWAGLEAWTARAESTIMCAELHVVGADGTRDTVDITSLVYYLPRRAAITALDLCALVLGRDIAEHAVHCHVTVDAIDREVAFHDTDIVTSEAVVDG